MLTNRIQHLVGSPQPQFAGAAESSSGSFVPCPLLVMFSPPHVQHIQAVYQMAAEQVRQQFQPRRGLLPAFSLN